MKALFVSIVLLLPLTINAQEIVGKWQLVKESTCIEDEMDDATSQTEQELVAEMHSIAGAAPQIIQFKANNSAIESTKIINRRKSYNSHSLLYKFTGSSLYILDKKSQTLIETFNVEKITADSLIISNSSRVCETRIFVKISSGKE